MMRVAIAGICCSLFSACGVETASTAATAAAIRKQELDAGKQSIERAQKKINQAVQLQQQRAADDGKQ